MTTLSIEDLKAWLAELNDAREPCAACSGTGLTTNMAGEPDKCRRCNGDTVARPEEATVETATIAALIEGYIAMAEALPALRNKIASEADQYNPPPILADDRSDYMAGVQAATHQAQCDFVFELDRILSALKIGGTND